MKIFLEKALFINRAPFDKLVLDFDESGISVLSSENGKGKTTILSHIVDAFHEMARPNFENEFEGKKNKLYRISSPIHNLDQSKPSFVYFRFKFPESTLDYVDIRNVCTEEQYNEAISIENKIPFNDLKPFLDEAGYVKKVTSSFDKKKAVEVFSSNLMTSFPSYRFELPGYLNDPYQVSLDFKKKHSFSGRMRNPIEVVSGLSQFANWIMDIVLDLRMDENVLNQIVFNNLNSIITHTLTAKNKGALRFGIGPRGFGGTRIQILENKENGEQVYPTIFNLSSGESSLLCLFGELLRQADNINNNILLPHVTGIVLVDEVDKHLHIKLQKEVLPSLLAMFPNVQFILSSHSPFLSLGLAEKVQNRSKLIDIERGIAIQPVNDAQYLEVYEMMLQENQNYKSMYESILSQVENEKELQIITEGKNTEHIRTAISVLDNSLLNKISIVTGSEDKSGDQQLKNAFVILANADHSNKFLFVWDCDSAAKVDTVTESETLFKFCFPQNPTNNKAKKGIENLYAEELFTDDVYDEKVTETDYGGSKTEVIFNKSKFLSKIKEVSAPDAFNNYGLFINKIVSIVSPPIPEE
jgi:hypothetical protein